MLGIQIGHTYYTILFNNSPETNSIDTMQVENLPLDNVVCTCTCIITVFFVQ